MEELATNLGFTLMTLAFMAGVIYLTFVLFMVLFVAHTYHKRLDKYDVRRIVKEFIAEGPPKGHEGYEDDDPIRALYTRLEAENKRREKLDKEQASANT